MHIARNEPPVTIRHTIGVTLRAKSRSVRGRPQSGSTAAFAILFASGVTTPCSTKNPSLRTCPPPEPSPSASSSARMRSASCRRDPALGHGLHMSLRLRSQQPASATARATAGETSNPSYRHTHLRLATRQSRTVTVPSPSVDARRSAGGTTCAPNVRSMRSRNWRWCSSRLNRWRWLKSHTTTSPGCASRNDATCARTFSKESPAMPCTA
mmetsp:Transcript_3091/g.11512  ORF Transcript_3091/g.11512 Transcript_3091/m.11512 type:complete len:211 (+) Transcript_3091:158-790(+)